MKRAIAVLIGIATIATLTACGSVSKSSSDSAENTTSEVQEETKAPTIGSTVTTDDGLAITLKGVRKKSSGELNTKPDNDFYLLVNVSIKNGTDETFSSSSLLCYDLAGDSGMTYDTAIFAGGNGSLDASVRSGRTLRGEVAFDANKEGKYYFSFTPSLTSDPIEFEFTSAQIK